MNRPEQVKIISGFNLGLILRLLAETQTVFTDDQLRCLVRQSRQDIVQISDRLQPASDF